MEKETKLLQTMLDAAEVTIRSQQKLIESLVKQLNRIDYEIEELKGRN